MSAMSSLKRMRAALELVEPFVAKELRFRRESFLPATNAASRVMVDDAQNCLRSIRDALGKNKPLKPKGTPKPLDFAAIIERGSCGALALGTDSGVKVTGDCRPEGRKMKPIRGRKR